MNKGVKLKERRKELRLTLKEVAAAVGVAEATVQRWESGNIVNFKVDKIPKLASVLQLPVEELTNVETPVSNTFFPSSKFSVAIKLYSLLDISFPS